MTCHICGQEAVSRCYTCGKLFCGEHGKENCARCSSAIRTGDPGQDRVSAARIRDHARPGWWRPQPAEEYAPPACYLCHGLARRVCTNCQKRYCLEHEGKGGLCSECAQSARVGVFILAGVMSLLGSMLLWNLIFSPR
jgi:hypothetical protein